MRLLHQFKFHNSYLNPNQSLISPFAISFNDNWLRLLKTFTYDIFNASKISFSSGKKTPLEPCADNNFNFDFFGNAPFWWLEYYNVCSLHSVLCNKYKYTLVHIDNIKLYKLYDQIRRNVNEDVILFRILQDEDYCLFPCLYHCCPGMI